MARTITAAQHQTLVLILGVLADLMYTETQPTKKAALTYSTNAMLEMIAPAKGPSGEGSRIGANTKAPASQDAPPEAAVSADKANEPKPPRTAEQRSAAAIQAAKTRKANKTNTAVTARTSEATGEAPAKSAQEA